MAVEAETDLSAPQIIPFQDLPTEKIWRVVVLLTPEQDLGFAGEFARDLAAAHRGELIFAVVVTSEEAQEQVQARETLEKAYQQAIEDNFDVAFLVIIPVDRKHVARDLRRVVKRAGFDFVLIRGDSYLALSVTHLPCDIGIIRGKIERLDKEPVDNVINKILVPTSGGPNTKAALDLLKPLCENREITALYIAPTYLGNRERAHGYTILRQILELTDLHRVVDRLVKSAADPATGIMEEARGDYDLVILGANEDSLERFLFGSVVDRVVHESNKPVLVYRRHKVIGSGLVSSMDLRLRQLMPHLDQEKRHETYSRIRENSRAEISFYVLITLSAAIAAFGLLQNSPAVVIGAMLVAPLMSPIIGVGLGMVLGEVRFLQMAFKSVLWGVGLALGVGFLVGLLWFNPDNLPAEVLNRTAPNLFDLGVAVFSGMAAAYALSYSQAAGALPGVAIAAALVPPLTASGIALAAAALNLDGDWPFLNVENLKQSAGALGLFGTNFITIINASALVFFVLGFRPESSEKAEKIFRQRSVRRALLVLLATTIILGYFTVNLFRERNLDRAIKGVVQDSIAEFNEGQDPNRLNIRYFQDPTFERSSQDRDVLDLNLTVRSRRQLFQTEAERLQGIINDHLQADGERYSVKLDLTVILVVIPDPDEERSDDN